MGAGEKMLYKAEVQEVHSGDDLVLMVDLGVDGLHKKVRVRLHGVDTPDAFKSSNKTEAGEVRDTVRKLTMGRKCNVHVHTQGRGGWIVTLSICNDDGSLTNLNKILAEAGHVYSRANTKGVSASG